MKVVLDVALDQEQGVSSFSQALELIEEALRNACLDNGIVTVDNHETEKLNGEPL